MDKCKERAKMRADLTLTCITHGVVFDNRRERRDHKYRTLMEKSNNWENNN